MNAKLRRCSHAARGAWVDVLCVLHDSDEYGIARYPLVELANASSAPIKLLRELVDKGVLKGCDKGKCAAFVYVPRSGRKDGEPVVLVAEQDGPVWYSSRMVKDEYVRTIRGESSRFGADKGDASKDAPKPPFGDGSSSSSSTSVNTVAKATGQEPDPIWGLGLAYLIECGDTERGARGFLGKMRKALDDDLVVAELLAEAQRRRVSEPKAWLRKAAQARITDGRVGNGVVL